MAKTKEVGIQRNKIEALAKVALLSDLSDRELAELAEDCQWQEYSSGEVIIEQGDPKPNFYVLVQGKVEVLFSKKGTKSLLVNTFGPGEVFGDVYLFNGKPTSTEFRCLESAKVLFMDSEHFAHMLLRWPQLYSSFIEKLSNRITQANVGLWEAKHKDFLRAGLRLNQLKYKFYDVWGGAKTTKEVEDKLEELRQNNDNLLLIGERGTGQQMMAWHLHKAQYGENAPFIVMDGRHIDQQWGDLLFEPHTNTDHTTVKLNGLLDLAERGTLFIRDINLISPRAQLKLAIALHTGEANCRIVGGLLAEPEQLAIRLIPQLQAQFKQEYKFAPIRERKKDIPVIVRAILEKLARQHGRITPVVDPEATKLLLTHHYRQGNVTELIQIIERAFFLAEGDIIGLEHLFFGPTGERIGRSINLLAWEGVQNLIKQGKYPRILQRLAFVILFLTTVMLFAAPNHRVANISLFVVWSLWWPSLVISASSFGRVWCGVCPVSYVMEQCQKIIHFNKPVPLWIKKYDYLIVTVLFLLVFWLEAITDMRFNRIYTGLWLTTIVALASIVGVIFTRHTWCRHLCPLGGLIGMASISGMIEVRADSEVCLNKCTTHSCYKGNDKVAGCPMSHHTPFLDSNHSCKLCLRCVRNCPNDAVKVNLRIPAREVWHLVRVNQGYAVFIGVALAILIPITYFEPLHHVWPRELWEFWFTVAYWGTALLAGMITWFLAKPFQTKAASRRIKLAFAFIPMVVAGYIAYQLHFAPGASTLMVGIGYKSGVADTEAIYISLLRVGQALAGFFGFSLTAISVIMVWLRTSKKKETLVK